MKLALIGWSITQQLLMLMLTTTHVIDATIVPNIRTAPDVGDTDVSDVECSIVSAVTHKSDDV